MPTAFNGRHDFDPISVVFAVLWFPYRWIVVGGSCHLPGRMMARTVFVDESAPGFISKLPSDGARFPFALGRR